MSHHFIISYPHIPLPTFKIERKKLGRNPAQGFFKKLWNACNGSDGSGVGGERPEHTLLVSAAALRENDKAPDIDRWRAYNGECPCCLATT